MRLPNPVLGTTTIQRPRRRLLLLLPAIALAGSLLCAGMPAPVSAMHGPHYPNLKTRPPSDLRYAQVSIDGVLQWVVRFSNTVWNEGEGPLELIGTSSGTKTNVKQRVYWSTTATGTYDEYPVGEFDFHPTHNHWHFGNFAKYELYTKAEWMANNTNGQKRGEGTKTTFCIIDTRRWSGSLPAAYTQCGQTKQGLTVGWGDTYPFSLADQWVVLGQSKLTEGADYVLRSVADPMNQLYESENKNDSAREGQAANQALTCFKIRRDRLRTTSC